MYFTEKHCVEHQYIFQIRRCDDDTCCVQPDTEQRPWVPDPVYKDPRSTHYKQFEDVLGTPTTEKDCPSSQKQTVAGVAEEQQV